MKRVSTEIILDSKYVLIQSVTCPFCFKVNLRILNKPASARHNEETKANICFHFEKFEYNFHTSKLDAIFSSLGNDSKMSVIQEARGIDY